MFKLFNSILVRIFSAREQFLFLFEDFHHYYYFLLIIIIISVARTFYSYRSKSVEEKTEWVFEMRWYLDPKRVRNTKRWRIGRPIYIYIGTSYICDKTKIWGPIWWLRQIDGQTEYGKIWSRRSVKNAAKKLQKTDEMDEGDMPVADNSLVNIAKE